MGVKQTEALKLALKKVQEFKARWWKVPPFGNKVNKATREAITNAHSPIFELENTIREALAEQPAPPLECKTDAEKTAFAFGWWKALEENRKQPAQDREPAYQYLLEQNRQLTAELAKFRAVSAQALEALEYISSHYMSLPKIGCMALAAGKEALAEQPAQQQEPVAYSYTSRITGAQGFSHHPMPRFIDAESWDIKPLYTTPPQRKPLTMQERTSIVRANKSFHDKNEIDAYGVIDDVEAAHGITGESK